VLVDATLIRLHQLPTDLAADLLDSATDDLALRRGVSSDLSSRSRRVEAVSRRRRLVRRSPAGVRRRQLCQRGGERRGVDRAYRLTCWLLAQRAGAKSIWWSRVAVGIERYEPGEQLLVPPAHSVEVDGRQSAVQEDGFAGIHLPKCVGRSELLALDALRDASSALALTTEERRDVAR